jgi:hypothetical protein
MLFLVDQEGATVLKSMIDIALKAGGFSNLNAVNAIVKAVKTIPPQGTKTGKVVEKNTPEVKDNAGDGI